ncbi:MAG: tetratricopeptide repeat protein [Candidatus Krumholzibacteriia bacterium]
MMIHPTGSPRRPAAVIFIAATLAALLVRVLYVLQMADPALNPAFVRPILDAAVNRTWALGLLDGSWPPAEPFFRAPLYPYFLAGLYAVFGPDRPLPVQLAHALVSSLGAGLAALCALRMWGRRAAWFAGLGFACLWPSIFFSGELLDVTLGVTLNLLLLWLLLDPEKDWRLGAAGLAWGLSAVCRPLILAVAPVVAVYLLRRGLRWRSRGMLFLAAGLTAAVLPVTAHNLLRGGEPVLIAASGGVNFYIGNNPAADGRVAFLPGAEPDWQGKPQEVVALAAGEGGPAATIVAADRYFLGKGMSYLWSEPRDAAALYARKAWLLLAAGERSNNKNLAFWRDRSSLLRLPVWLGWAPVLAFALVGLLRNDHDRSRGFLIRGLLVAYSLALLLFFINARFRLPLLAWLVVPAGAGADSILRAIRLPAWRPGTLKAAAMAAVVLLAVWVPDGLTFRQEPGTDFESFRILGDGHLAAGRADLAEEAYVSALAADGQSPGPAAAWSLPAVYGRLGGILLQEGRYQSAESLFAAWIKRLPDDAGGRLYLADLMLRTGRPEQAWPHLEEILARDPDNLQARLGRGWARLRTADAQGALEDFRVVESRTDDLAATFGAGMSLMEMGAWRDAERTFLALLNREPGYWQAYGNLAGLYEKTGRPDDAIIAWERLLEVNPADAGARARLQELRSEITTTNSSARR